MSSTKNRIANLHAQLQKKNAEVEELQQKLRESGSSSSGSAAEEIRHLRRVIEAREELLEKLREELHDSERNRGNNSQVAQQVDKLRKALETAKGKLLEQKEMLDQLTTPPLAYATVVALEKSTFVPKEEYEGMNGGTQRIDTAIKSLGDYHVGDKLEVVYNDVVQKVREARTIVIASFDSRNSVWILCDDRFVASCSVSEMPRYFRVTGSFYGPPTAVIVLDGKFPKVLLPKDCEVNPGDTVTVSMQTMQVTGLAQVQAGGDIAYVRRVIDETFSEVDHQSSVRVVFNGKLGTAVEKGDRVVLDASAAVIIRNLGKEDERFSFTAETNVTWDDIGGLAEAKQQMIEAVELPHTNQDIFRFYGKTPVKGVLLYGPPGCGKTMLGKATATALARIYGNNSKSSGFIYVKGPEILDRYVGVAEATIRQIFSRARKHRETCNYPAVVFIDEADAILAKRGSGISSDMERTIVPMFLTEMDGLEDSGALVILATNRSDILDPAVVRDGRVDRKVKVTRPTQQSATEIFLLSLKRVPLFNGYDRDELAKFGARELFSPRRVLYKVTTKSHGDCQFTLGNIVNGGMIVSVVDQATSIALHRDLAAKKQGQGLCREDLVAAVNSVEQQNRDLNHNDELSEFVHDFRDEVLGVKKLRQST
ncbi:MAG: AAA family ATPase [Candidatus Staskawiczbacteria bacterium]|jgi:proteasome-associated ATPase